MFSALEERLGHQMCLVPSYPFQEYLYELICESLWVVEQPGRKVGSNCWLEEAQKSQTGEDINEEISLLLRVRMAF